MNYRSGKQKSLMKHEKVIMETKQDNEQPSNGIQTDIGKGNIYADKEPGKSA